MNNMLSYDLGIPEEAISEFCIKGRHQKKGYGHIIYTNRHDQLIVASIISTPNPGFRILEEVAVEGPSALASYYHNRNNRHTNGKVIDGIIGELEARASSYLNYI